MKLPKYNPLLTFFEILLAIILVLLFTGVISINGLNKRATLYHEQYLLIPIIVAGLYLAFRVAFSLIYQKMEEQGKLYQDEVMYNTVPGLYGSFVGLLSLSIAVSVFLGAFLSAYSNPLSTQSAQGLREIDTPGGALIVFAALIIIDYVHFKNLQKLKNTPTSTIRSSTMGLNELHAQVLSRKKISNDPSIIGFKLERIEGSGKHRKSYEYLYLKDLYLKDATGELRVRQYADTIKNSKRSLFNTNPDYAWAEKTSFLPKTFWDSNLINEEALEYEEKLDVTAFIKKESTFFNHVSYNIYLFKTKPEQYIIGDIKRDFEGPYFELKKSTPVYSMPHDLTERVETNRIINYLTVSAIMLLVGLRIFLI